MRYPTQRRIFVGFDGSIDSSVKPIRTAGSPNDCFSTIGEFGSYIAGKAGLSCSVQLEVRDSHAGGNAPYFAQTLRSLGFEVCLAGMLGYERIREEFRVLERAGISLFSFAEPSLSQCFEFDDGKIMLSPQLPSMDKPFERLSVALGESLECLWTYDAVAMLNWGELPWMQQLWTSALDCMQSSGGADLSKILYLDLADISCRTGQDIELLLSFLRRASRLRHTILSMNENELLALGKALGGKKADCELLAELIEKGYASETVLHTVRFSAACDGRQTATVATCHVDKPLISTGAGDNFNAGYCAATLWGMPLEEKLTLANRAAHTYLTTGRPEIKSNLGKL